MEHRSLILVNLCLIAAGCGRATAPAPAAPPIPITTTSQLGKAAIGMKDVEFWELAKSVGCEGGRGYGPTDGFVANVDCKDGTRYSTVWDGDQRLKKIELVWDSKNSPLRIDKRQ